MENAIAGPSSSSSSNTPTTPNTTTTKIPDLDSHLRTIILGLESASHGEKVPWSLPDKTKAALVSKAQQHLAASAAASAAGLHYEPFPKVKKEKVNVKECWTPETTQTPAQLQAAATAAAKSAESESKFRKGGGISSTRSALQRVVASRAPHSTISILTWPQRHVPWWSTGGGSGVNGKGGIGGSREKGKDGDETSIVSKDEEDGEGSTPKRDGKRRDGRSSPEGGRRCRGRGCWPDKRTTLTFLLGVLTGALLLMFMFVYSDLDLDLDEDGCYPGRRLLLPIPSGLGFVENNSTSNGSNSTNNRGRSPRNIEPGKGNGTGNGENGTWGRGQNSIGNSGSSHQKGGVKGGRGGSIMITTQVTKRPFDVTSFKTLSTTPTGLSPTLPVAPGSSSGSKSPGKMKEGQNVDLSPTPAGGGESKEFTTMSVGAVFLPVTSAPPHMSNKPNSTSSNIGLSHLPQMTSEPVLLGSHSSHPASQVTTMSSSAGEIGTRSRTEVMVVTSTPEIQSQLESLTAATGSHSESISGVESYPGASSTSIRFSPTTPAKEVGSNSNTTPHTEAKKVSPVSSYAVTANHEENGDKRIIPQMSTKSPPETTVPQVSAFMVTTQNPIPTNIGPHSSSHPKVGVAVEAESLEKSSKNHDQNHETTPEPEAKSVEEEEKQEQKSEQPVTGGSPPRKKRKGWFARLVEAVKEYVVKVFK